MNYRAPTSPPVASHDYGRALQNAISWLGDRYLLAAPLPRRSIERPKYWTAMQHAAAHETRLIRR